MSSSITALIYLVVLVDQIQCQFGSIGNAQGDMMSGCPLIPGIPTFSGRAYVKSIGQTVPTSTNIDLLPGMNDLAADRLVNSGFDLNKPTVLYSHGWQETAELGWLQTIRERYATQYPPGDKPFNLLQYDWSCASHFMYPQAVMSAPILGQRLGSFLNTLHDKYNYSMSNMHLVGFSLSTHIMGAAGRELKNAGNTARQITALDSAGPCFYTNTAFARANTLSPDAAEQVVARHYGDNKYGARRPIGGVDIFVNGGKNQPSMMPTGRRKRDIPDLAGLRDHVSTEMHEYNTVAHRDDDTCQSIAYRCDSYAKFLQGSCATCDQPTDCYHIDTFHQTENFRNSSANIRYPPNTKMFIQTAPGHRCLHHYQVVVRSKDGADSILRSGRAKIDLGSGVVATPQGQVTCRDGSAAYTALVTSPVEMSSASATLRAMSASDIDSVQLNYLSHKDKGIRDSKSMTLCPSGSQLVRGSCNQAC